MTLVNPRVDMAFKKIFGAEENKDLLISLVNSIVSEEDQVVDLTLMNPYNLQSFKQDKLSILDIKAKDRQGQLYNIEMQVSDYADYDKRALYSWAKLYKDQLKEAQDYEVLRKSIGIHVLNFTCIPGAEHYHNKFNLTTETGLAYFKDIELHTIELSRFEGDKYINYELSDYLKVVKTSLDRWVLFLTKHALLRPDSLPKEVDDPSIKKALHALDVLNFDQEERYAYEAHLEWLRMEVSVNKKRFMDGKEEGREEGRAEGRAEGRVEERLAVARNMLADNFDITVIAKLTGFDEEGIRALKQRVDVL